MNDEWLGGHTTIYLSLCASSVNTLTINKTVTTYNQAATNRYPFHFKLLVVQIFLTPSLTT